MTQTIVFAMLRRSVAQGLIAKINDATDSIRAIYESDYDKAVSAASASSADAVVIEITEFGGYDTDYCLELCDHIKIETPGCRLLLICPEQNEESVSTVGEAKLSGRIDDFLFYSSTTDYLLSKLLAT